MLRWVARVALVVILSMCVAGSAMAADEPWRDASQPPGQRADELLAAMTPDQKVAMALGDYASLASLGVPTLPSDDGPSGIRADGTTSLPSAQTLAATFDRDLARAYGEAIGAEARGKGFNWWLGPAMDIARTPLAGRQPENLGEDPFLAGETVAQEVAGAKSAPRDRDAQALRRQQRGVGPHRLQHPDRAQRRRERASSPSARCRRSTRRRSSARSGGPRPTPSCAPTTDSTGRRRARARRCSPTSRPRASRASWPPTSSSPSRTRWRRRSPASTSPRSAGPAARTAAMFTSGQVPAARLDDIVRRTLFAMFDSGAFDDPLGPAAADVSTPEHQALATKVSAGGMVLLRNERHALPLGGRGLRSIAVIGPSGDDADLHQRRLVGRDAGPRRDRHPAGRDPRAGRFRGRRHRGAGLAGRRAADDDRARRRAPGSRPSYWNNGDLSGTPALTRSDPTIDLAAAPTGVGPLWSARWTGTVTPTESGLYRFSLLQAGLATLWVDGQRVGPGYREGVQFIAGPRYPMQAARPPHGRQARIDPRRLLELGAALRRAGPPRVAAAVGVGHPGGGRGGTPRRRGDRAGEPGRGRGHGPCRPRTARRPGPAHRRRRRGQPQDDRRARHGRPGADAVAAPRGGRAPGLVSGPAVRRRARLGAVRRQRPGRAAARHLPGQRDAGAGAADAARALPGRQRRAALRRGHLRRLPLVRPVPPAARCSRSATASPTRTSASATFACASITAA